EPQAQQPDRFTAATRLSMAGGAHAAGDWEVSFRLLKSAVSEGLQAAEELYAALSLAGSFREEELFVDLLSQLRRTYPEEVLTARAGYLDLFNNSDFAGALKVAEELKLPIEVAQCRACLSPVIDAREFLREMES